MPWFPFYNPRAIDRMAEVGLTVLAVLGFVGWLGGGRKWAFRTLLSALVLVGVGVVGIFFYGYMTDRVAERRARKIHECAIAKVAKAQCQPPSKDAVPTTQDPYAAIAVTCPPYILFDDPTPEQENAAVAAAEEECAREIDPKQKSLHDQISQYRREHATKESAKNAVDYDALAKKSGAIKSRLGDAGCAALGSKGLPSHLRRLGRCNSH